MDNWQHRSENMTCGTCMWYVPKPAHMTGKEPPDKEASPAQLGRCRRRSPTMSGFPVMFKTDWCGDHKLDERRA